jgi:hypothetical protein
VPQIAHHLSEAQRLHSLLCAREHAAGEQRDERVGYRLVWTLDLAWGRSSLRALLAFGLRRLGLADGLDLADGSVLAHVILRTRSDLFFEAADTDPERSPDLREPARPEEQDDDEEDDQQFPRSQRHTRRLAGKTTIPAPEDGGSVTETPHEPPSPAEEVRQLVADLPNDELLAALDTVLLELERRLLRYARIGHEILEMANEGLVLAVRAGARLGQAQSAATHAAGHLQVIGIGEWKPTSTRPGWGDDPRVADEAD